MGNGALPDPRSDRGRVHMSLITFLTISLPLLSRTTSDPTYREGWCVSFCYCIIAGHLSSSLTSAICSRVCLFEPRFISIESQARHASWIRARIGFLRPGLVMHQSLLPKGYISGTHRALINLYIGTGVLAYLFFPHPSLVPNYRCTAHRLSPPSPLPALQYGNPRTSYRL